MFDNFYAYISELNAASIAIRLFLAGMCGGIIGLERGRKGQAAGCRTHMLVCVGAASVMMTNLFVYNNFGGVSDPTRIGAQVVSGIGFLGAGTIIVTSKNQIKGLTTAAGLWASGCMGLAIGIGFYELALIGTAFILLIIGILNKLDNKVYGKSRNVEVYVELTGFSVLKKIIQYSRDSLFEVKHIQVLRNKELDKCITGILLTIKLKNKCDHAQIIADISSIEGVSYIEEL